MVFIILNIKIIDHPMKFTYNVNVSVNLAIELKLLNNLDFKNMSSFAF